jgi:hypothetical protein
MGGVSKRRAGGRHAARAGGVPVAAVLSSDGGKAEPAQRAGWTRKAQVGALGAGVLVVGGLLGTGIPAALGTSPLGAGNGASQTSPQAEAGSPGKMLTIAPVDSAEPSTRASSARTTRDRGRDGGDASKPSATAPPAGGEHPETTGHAVAGGGAATSSSSGAASSQSSHRHSPSSSEDGGSSRASAKHDSAPAGSPPTTTERPKGSQASHRSGSSGGSSDATSPRESSHPSTTSTPSRTRDGGHGDNDTGAHHSGSSRVSVESPPRRSCAVNVLGIGLLCH